MESTVYGVLQSMESCSLWCDTVRHQQHSRRLQSRPPKTDYRTEKRGEILTVVWHSMVFVALSLLKP